MEIEVRLGGAAEAFDGPLDLLLALVRRNRYPLDRLPVAEITRQYLTYIKDAAESHGTVELGGEFIETASWLVLLKSRTLLPSAENAGSGEPDPPEQELRRVLLDHATLQQAAALLGERLEQVGLAAAKRDRTPEREIRASVSAPVAAAPNATPTLQDAVTSARRALEAVRAHAELSTDHSPGHPLKRPSIEEELARVLIEISSLAPEQARSTAPWFQSHEDPEARAALFLALLELARLSRILLGQPRNFGPIYLKRIVG